MKFTEVTAAVFLIAATIEPATAEQKKAPFIAKPDVLPTKLSTVTSFGYVTVGGSRRRICAGACFASGGEQPTNYWLCDWQDRCGIECAVSPPFGYCTQ